MRAAVWKRCLGMLGLGAVVATPLAAVSCSVGSDDKDYVSAGHIYSDWHFSEKPTVLDMSRIQSSDQLLSLPSMTDYYNGRMVVGSYGEQREFYATKSTDAVHYGMDLLVPAGTPVYAPYKGDLLFASFVNQNSTITTANEGIGGVAVLRVRVADMDNLSAQEKADLLSLLTNERSAKKPYVAKQVDYVYIQLLHLSPLVTEVTGDTTINLATGSVTFKTAEHINYSSPLAVERGQLLGEVGSVEENGGWAPHVHVQLMNPASDASLVRFATGDPKSVATIRAAAVGPRSNITNGTILDANIFLKVLQTRDGSYSVPPTLSYATTYVVVDPAAPSNITVTLPFPLGQEKLPVIDPLPAGSASYSDWSAPVYKPATGSGTVDPATLKAGDKFTATYTRTSASLTPGSYKLTATYTVVDPSLPDGFLARYFIMKGSMALPVPPFLPTITLPGYEQWSAPTYSGSANKEFYASSIPLLSSSATFYVTYVSQPQLVNRRVTVYPV